MATLAAILSSCGGSIAKTGSMLSDEQRTMIAMKEYNKSIPKDSVAPSLEKKSAIFAGGCFWGIEYLMQQQDGVIDVESGYTGGWSDNPTYLDLRANTTGHAEAVRVYYDPAKCDYETLAKLFFEIHDPTQLNRQGPDIGNQYRSELFYSNESEKAIGERLIDTLKDKGFKVVTKLTKVSKFYPAEEYHQDYYQRNGSTPYCHAYTKRF